MEMEVQELAASWRKELNFIFDAKLVLILMVEAKFHFLTLN